MADFCAVRTGGGCCIVQIFAETCEKRVEKMADDLVKRLREPVLCYCSEAADRIEALEKALVHAERERKYLLTIEQSMRAAADARREALEEAARVVDEFVDQWQMLGDAGERVLGMQSGAKDIAAAIRALMEEADEP